YDAQPGAAAIAKDAIGQSLGKLAEKSRLKPAEVQATLGRIEVADSLQGFAPCHVVIEAIVEDLNEKRRIFSSLENVVAQTCILASNTSSLSVTAMAAACKRPGRVAGYHFFNPVPVLKIVEVVDGVRTEPWVAAGLLGRKTGRGWYAYGKDGAAEPLAEPPAPKARPDSVWAVPEFKELFPRIEKDPSQASVCFVAPLGKDATSTALELGL